VMMRTKDDDENVIVVRCSMGARALDSVDHDHDLPLILRVLKSGRVHQMTTMGLAR